MGESLRAYLLVPYDDDLSFVLRGHLTAEQAFTLVNRYNERAWNLDGAPHHSWARCGFWYDEDGDRRSGGVLVSKTYQGQRGAFAVTCVDVRAASEAP